MCGLAVKITEVAPRSIAEKHGIRPGDSLLTINGHEVVDVLDYRFYMAEEDLTLTLRTSDGTDDEKHIHKREYDDLGLEFSTYLMDRQRFCRNKCVFCFVDQMPKGLRESLYFKDDDSRMSFLFGNYITLTNLTDADVDRIIAMRTSPVNISVHTTNPELRVRMMKHPEAGRSLRFIQRLTDAGIKVNAQIVLCPGINDGAELDRSLRELCALAPNLQSVAVVPVGLTKFREGLPELRLHTKEDAQQAIETVASFAAENLSTHGVRVCFAADELYLNAGFELPPYEDYEEFSQLENGVGLLSLLTHEFDEALSGETEAEINRRITIATGVSAKPAIERMAKSAMEKFPGLCVNVVAVENKFFGESVTVAGLVTGGDLVGRITGEEIGDELLIPAVMLRHERDLFLDGVSLDNVREALGRPVRAVENDGYELLDAILGRKE